MLFKKKAQPRHPAPSVSGSGSSWKHIPYGEPVYPNHVQDAGMADTTEFMYDSSWHEITHGTKVIAADAVMPEPSTIKITLNKSDGQYTVTGNPPLPDPSYSVLIPREDIALPLESQHDVTEKLDLLPDASVEVSGTYSPAQESYIETVFADAAMNNAGDGAPAEHATDTRTALIIMIDPSRYLLTIGSLIESSWVVPMAQSADELLLSVGYRRASSWEWLSGFLSCDIVCDD